MGEIRCEWLADGLRRRLIEDERGYHVVTKHQDGWRRTDTVGVSDLVALIGPPKGSQIQTQAPEEMPAFEEFWEAYPAGHKVKKPDARKAWKQTARSRPPLPELLAGLERWKASDKWIRGYVEHPASWLRAAMWADVPPPPASGKLSTPAPSVHRSTNVANLSKRVKR